MNEKRWKGKKKQKKKKIERGEEKQNEHHVENTTQFNLASTSLELDTSQVRFQRYNH